MMRWEGPRAWAFDIRELGGRQIIHLSQHDAIVADLADVQQLEAALEGQGLSLGEFAERPAAEGC
ncbi:hypothetical protein [Actinomadura harenae]|nr:hypothetical protein [Actinomadura harenae]